MSVLNTSSIELAADGGDPDLVLLVVEEAARRLSISRSTCYELVLSRQLRSIKIGKLRRIPVSALAEFIAAREADES